MTARDNAAWARELGVAALCHIGMAVQGDDRRIAHEYHEERAVRFARRAAHHAYLADPSLRDEEPA